MHLWPRRNNARVIKAQLSAVRSDLQALQHDIRGLADSVGGAAAQWARPADKVLESALERVNDWPDGLGSLRDTVRKQKMASMMLTIGVGALVGAFLFRR